MTGEGGLETRRASVDRVRQRLNELLESWRSPVADLAAAVTAIAEPPHDGDDNSAISEAALDDLVPSVERLVHSARSIIGAGFIAAPGLVDDCERYMLWLQKRDGAARRLRLNFDTSDVDAYDYVRMDWYSRARSTRGACLTGPYLDYSGSDHIVVTLTVAANCGSQFAGVAGIDLSAHAAEGLLVEQLRALAADAVVFNDERLVVAANSARWMPGERVPAVRGEALGLDQSERLVDWSGWRLGVARSEIQRLR